MKTFEETSCGGGGEGCSGGALCVVVAVVVKVLYVIRGEWQSNEECAGNGRCLE